MCEINKLYTDNSRDTFVSGDLNAAKSDEIEQTDEVAFVQKCVSGRQMNRF